MIISFIGSNIYETNSVFAKQNNESKNYWFDLSRFIGFMMEF